MPERNLSLIGRRAFLLVCYSDAAAEKRYEIKDESLFNLPHLQDVLDQLLLVVQGVLEAEQDAADHPDDQHHADDYERGGHNQE